MTDDEVKVEFVEHALASLGWEEIFIIFEEEHEALIQTLTSDVSAGGEHRLYRLARTSGQGREAHIMTAISDSLMTTDTLNAVVACSLSCIYRLLSVTTTLEAEFKRRVSVIQSTKWLLLPTHLQASDAAVLQQIFYLGFDNIALMAQPGGLPLPYQVPEEYWCMSLTLSTLLWRGEGRREMSTVGHHCPTMGPTVTSDIFPNVNFGFNGRKFIVTTLPWEPYMMIRRVNGTEEFYGLCADLMEELARTLNFTFSWTQPADRKWGSETNGSWSGLVGQLQRQEVDLVMAPLTMSRDREGVMDFTFPFYHDFSGVLLKRPDPNAKKWRTYLDILRWQVLLCLVLALVGGSVVCVGIEAGERYIFGRTNLWIALNRVWVLIGALLSQGCRQLPRRGSGRVFLSSWWIFSILMAATYSANLIAFLTVTKDESPFDTLEEMVEQTDYTYGTLGHSIWTMLFEQSNLPTYKAIDRNMKEFVKDDPRVLALDPYVQLEKVREGGYAYIADTGLFKSWIATNCDLMLIKETFHPSKYCVGLPNDSAYTKLFSDQVLKIYESGLLQVMIKKWWPKRNFCSGESLTTAARVLTLVDLQSVFYVAGLGVGLSMAAILLEYLIVGLCPGIKRGKRGRVLALKADEDIINEGFANS